MKIKGKIFFYSLYKTGLHIFAVIGFVLVVGFFAVRWHWTDVQGSIDSNNKRFSQLLLENKEKQVQSKVLGTEGQKNFTEDNSLASLDYQIKQLSEKKTFKAKNYCLIDAIGRYSPGTAAKIIEIYRKTNSDNLVSKVILAARLRIEEKNGSDIFDECETGNIQADDKFITKKYLGSVSKTIFPWMDNEEWSTIEEAIVKDKEVIEKAALVVGIESRLLVSCAIVEQVRLFNSNRELFKKFFEPLKILGNANKISLGVMGIKESTAIDTENHLKDPNSPYYLGTELQHVLDFENGDESSRFSRLTEDTHYYSYLYGAVYLKEIMNQWEKAGYDIKDRPEIIGTLFNVGFPQSKPNPNPKVGGSNIEVRGTKYTFGSLVYEFYYSGELLDVFPYKID